MTHEEQIEEIMDYFNFDRVNKVMVALGWAWSSLNGVPEKAELRQRARELLRSVAKDKHSICHATGGFHASKDEWGNLSLQFVVAEWDTMK